MSEREPIGGEENPGGLPPAYWWADGEDHATLYERYGWVATVKPTGVTIAGRFRGGPRITGPCQGVAHGKRMVERFLAVRNCWGTPEQQARRWDLRRERRQRRGGVGDAADPDGDGALLNP